MVGTNSLLEPGKPLIQSKSFWGHVLQLVPLLDIAATAAGIPGGAVSTSISIISGAVGGLIGIWGTYFRKEKISGIIVAKDTASV